MELLGHNLYDITTRENPTLNYNKTVLDIPRKLFITQNTSISHRNTDTENVAHTFPTAKTSRKAHRSLPALALDALRLSGANYQLKENVISTN